MQRKIGKKIFIVWKTLVEARCIKFIHRILKEINALKYSYKL